MINPIAIKGNEGKRGFISYGKSHALHNNRDIERERGSIDAIRLYFRNGRFYCKSYSRLYPSRGLQGDFKTLVMVSKAKGILIDKALDSPLSRHNAINNASNSPIIKDKSYLVSIW